MYIPTCPGIAYLCIHMYSTYVCSMYLYKLFPLQSAVLGLHLKPGRSRNDLTIIYFYWSEPKRRLMACVAELKSHLVKQLQASACGDPLPNFDCFPCRIAYMFFITILREADQQFMKIAR